MTSCIVKFRSDTLNSPKCRARAKIESRVTPGKIVPSRGGVTNSRWPDKECSKAMMQIMYKTI